jgi:hypothetical protein
MKLKDITEWSARWSTPSGFLDAHPTLQMAQAKIIAVS